MERIFYVKNGICPRNMDPLMSSSLIKISPSIIIAVKFQAQFQQLPTKLSMFFIILSTKCYSTVGSNVEIKITYTFDLLKAHFSLYVQSSQKENEEVLAAVQLAAAVKSVLECPVCYQTCQPPR
jgi:hypothetical protein